MASISFTPCRGEEQLCPLCYSTENIRHVIRFYRLWPLSLTQEHDTISRAALCQRRGMFILDTDHGFMVQDPARSVEQYLDNPESENDYDAN